MKEKRDTWAIQPAFNVWEYYKFSDLEAWKFICVGDNMMKIQLFDQTHESKQSSDKSNSSCWKFKVNNLCVWSKSWIFLKPQLNFDMWSLRRVTLRSNYVKMSYG